MNNIQIRNILIITLFLLSSCVTSKVTTKSNKIIFKHYYDGDGGYDADGTWSIVEIDSCEYIKGWGGELNGGPFFTHKGNCKFCQKRITNHLENIK